MKRFKSHYTLFPRKLNGLFFALLFPVLIIFSLSSCKSKFDYFDYVSELRGNYFTAANETLSLRVYAVEKEYPYATDGVKHDTTRRAEFYLVAPSGEKGCTLSFSIDGQNYGGEMSYDIVKAEYYYSCGLDLFDESELNCRILYGDQEYDLTAKTVKTAETLTPNEVLELVKTNQADLFTQLTDQYGFNGEICIRLIFEESPYYYVGVVARDGKMTAFLLNAETGKILAKRQS